ncbi:membrane protein [Sorangium cellulosum]|uniref:Membrane protein n=1 Tax=Sorangium cellulosum TaxID=56 RepID=A0A2L0EU13_SORCE|nr:hypothetical protein [Sorangium cellulosum]AUX42798.1 membrane protein [Sorangium cellulosum]
MEHSPNLAAFVLAVAALSTSACVAPLDPEEETEGSASQAIHAHNALTSNALTSNALTSNALTSNALTSNALTSNALTSNALTADALHDPAARTLLRYVVGCALPAGERFTVDLDGTTFAFHGELGLAQGWGKEGGACDKECRTWVSGCVIARVNYLGERVSISVRGDRAELQADKAERREYHTQEATYYGDIFSAEPHYHACLPRHAWAIPRVCGPSTETCAIEIAGRCDEVCEAPRRDGSFPNCRATFRTRSGERHVRRAPYHGSITVFLR